MTKQSSKQLILDVVANSFIYQSVGSTHSTTEIARLAGVTQPLIHYHFKNLRQLLVEAWLYFQKKYADDQVLAIVRNREVSYNGPISHLLIVE